MEKWSKARAEEFLAQGYWFGSLPSAMKRSIIEHSELRQFQQDLRNNEIYYHLAPGLGRI